MLGFQGLRNDAQKNSPAANNSESHWLGRFCLDSSVLLLDEPTANLDPNSATIIEKAILSKKSSQRIIVMATHNLNQARRMADEIVHIHNGEVVEAGNPTNFFENPKSEITRKFINGELDF